MSIQRWDWDNREQGMSPRDGGDYVTIEDYEKLIDKFYDFIVVTQEISREISKERGLS